ncbi:MAG: hypothetical protein U0325_27485, partial [Polyangiales bacterium]
MARSGSSPAWVAAAIEASTAALEGFDLERARETLSAALRRAPTHAELVAAWVALCADCLGDDAAALDAGRRLGPRDLDVATRSRLLAAAARGGALDDGARWAGSLDPSQAPDELGAWL